MLSQQAPDDAPNRSRQPGLSYTQRLNTLNLVSGRLVSSEQMRRPRWGRCTELFPLLRLFGIFLDYHYCFGDPAPSYARVNIHPLVEFASPPCLLSLNFLVH
jgi:hypothetical protein